MHLLDFTRGVLLHRATFAAGFCAWMLLAHAHLIVYVLRPDMALASPAASFADPVLFWEYFLKQVGVSTSIGLAAVMIRLAKGREIAMTEYRLAFLSSPPERMRGQKTFHDIEAAASYMREGQKIGQEFVSLTRLDESGASDISEGFRAWISGPAPRAANSCATSTRV